MRKLLPFVLVLCSGLPLFAAAYPDTTLYIQKDTLLGRYPGLRLEWQLLINGAVAQKGVIPFLTLSSRHPNAIHILAKFPTGNEEAFLRLVFRRPGTTSGATRSAPLLTRLLRVRSWKGDYSIPPDGEIAVTDSNSLFTITSPNALFQFDKESGWLLRYESNHIALMNDSTSLRPVIWPMSVTRPRLQLFATSTGRQLVIVRTEYTLPEVSCLLHMSYTINARGDLLVGQSLETDSGGQGPAIPQFGMNWILPFDIDSATWYASPEDTIAPEIVAGTLETIPTANIRWVAVTSPDNQTIRVVADSALLRLRYNGRQLGLQRPAPAFPMPYGSYQYSFKISPLLRSRARTKSF